MSGLRQALIDMDLAELRAVWAQEAPHLPQPNNDAEAEATAHHARTQAESIPLRMREYSHRWLIDRGFPSGLPDHLKPKAERVYPVVVEGVGVMVTAASDLTRPIASLVRDAMSDAVAECYADGRKDPAIVRQRMAEARRGTVKRLLGIDGDH